MQLSLSENIKIFNNAEFGEIRVMLIDNDPWFVGKDIAVALGYKDTVNALKAHVDEQDKRGWRITTPLRRTASNHHQRIRPVQSDFQQQTGKRTAVQALGHSRGLTVHPQAWNVHDRQPVGDGYCQPGLCDRADSEHEVRKGEECSVADAEQATL